MFLILGMSLAGVSIPGTRDSGVALFCCSYRKNRIRLAGKYSNASRSYLDRCRVIGGADLQCMTKLANSTVPMGLS